jgi:ATP-dependent RNA helicase DDX27
MEATKAANLINHEAEILTRPKRAWFLTARQKAEIVEASKQAVGLPEPQKDEDAERRAAKAAKHKRNAEAKGAPLFERKDFAWIYQKAMQAECRG